MNRWAWNNEAEPKPPMLESGDSAKNRRIGNQFLCAISTIRAGQILIIGSDATFGDIMDSIAMP